MQPPRNDELDALKSAMFEIRPQHARKWGQFTREWYSRCDRAFCDAMEAELSGTPIKRRGPQRNHDWTELEIATLKRMWLEGVKSRDIAAQIGVISPSTVCTMAAKLGLPGRCAKTKHRGEMQREGDCTERYAGAVKDRNVSRTDPPACSAAA